MQKSPEMPVSKDIHNYRLDRLDSLVLRSEDSLPVGLLAYLRSQ